MCGIVGICDLSSGASQLDAMSAAIAHRGPDADGTWSSSDDARRVQFGHRRLSIIDLSAAANQPFVKDGLALVFGGEIYNYRELRAELQISGSSFRTNSDTEVLLRRGAGGARPASPACAECSRSRCSMNMRALSPSRATSSG